MDKKLEKKQVLVFLKILKISKKLSPAEIATKLISTGWDEVDAHNAASVLYPDYTPSVPDVSSTALPDLPSTEIPQPTHIGVTPSTQTEAVLDIPPPAPDSTEIPLPTPPFSSEVESQSSETEPDSEAVEAGSYEEEFIAQNVSESEKEPIDVSEGIPPEPLTSVPSVETDITPETSWSEHTTADEVTPETEIPAQEYVSLPDDTTHEESSVRDIETTDEFVADTVSNTSDESSYSIPEPEQVDINDSVLTATSPDENRWKKDQVKVASTPVTPPIVRSMSDTTVAVPHQDAPWLKDQTDIYDITEEEKELLIKTVLNSHDKLNPKTVHALLGIDVSLSEYESIYRRKRRRGLPEWLQTTIIIIISIVMAAGLLYYGLRHFEVGPFHPSVIQSR